MQEKIQAVLKTDDYIKRIQILSEVRNLQLNFRGSITMLIGGSNTYKSLTVEMLDRMFKEANQEWKNNKLPKFLKLNLDDVDYDTTEEEILKKLRSNKYGFIAIDNADTVIGKQKKILDYIKRDTKTQYLIVTKDPAQFGTTTNHVSKMEDKGNYITNRFLTSIKGWK